MEKTELEIIINTACNLLYERERILIDNRTHERTIVARLCIYLSPLLGETWAVDCEYNREGKKGDSKRNESGALLYPDLIVHTRGEIQGPNLVAIQAKGYWNTEDRSKDENDLQQLHKKYNYKYLYRLEFGKQIHQLILISPNI